MDKRQVIKHTRQYMNHIRHLPDKIKDIRQNINDLETSLNLSAAASTSRIDGTPHKTPFYSITSGTVERCEDLRERIAAHIANIERLEKEREKVKAAIKNAFYISRCDWGEVLTMKYFDNLTTADIARLKHTSKSTIGTMENNGLLSLANILLNLSAEGECYDYAGRYIPITAKQKYNIENWEKTTDIPRVSE